MGLHTFPNHVPGLRYLKMFDETQTLYCGQGHPLFDNDLTYEGSELEAYDYAARS